MLRKNRLIKSSHGSVKFTNIKILKLKLNFFYFFLLMIISLSHYAYSQPGELNDELKGEKAIRKLKAERARFVYKSMKPHFIVDASAMMAFLETDLAFVSNQNPFGAKISLENSLGLDDAKPLFSLVVEYRISQRSNIYGTYYGLHRESSAVVENDIPFLDIIIPKGTQISSYFSTYMASLGYMFTILNKEQTFFGAYLNLTLMNVKTGVSANGTPINKNVQLYAPLPTIGLIARFDLNDWFGLSANVGTFSVKVSDFQARINNASIMADFTATKWLTLKAGYHTFDLDVTFFKQNHDITVDYLFRGPAIGLLFRF